MKNQSVKLSEDKLLKNLKYKGGIFKKDGTEIPATTGIGIITGYDFLECIDVDTKVFFNTTRKKMNFGMSIIPR